MAGPEYRRVVTGLNEAGKSCAIIDEPVKRADPVANIVWRNATIPADNSGARDEAAAFDTPLLHDGGVNFILTEMPAGQSGEAFMHATDTIDYLVVMAGEMTLVLEAEEVVLRPGDLIVDRGIVHGWRNDGAETAVMASVTVPALPVGAGRTV